MGGYVALSLAARDPERLRALMLFDTKSAADTTAAAALREKNARAIDESGSTEDFLRGMMPKLFADSTRRDAPEIVKNTEAIMRRSLAEGVSATLRALASRPDRTDILATMAVPCLVVVGEEDAISPPEEMEEMAEMIPRCRFSVIPHAGHLAPLENSAAVNQAIGAFLDGLGP
jgi:pimeloyl-ACP methyl ester carboxylesterase